MANIIQEVLPFDGTNIKDWFRDTAIAIDCWKEDIILLMDGSDTSAATCDPLTKGQWDMASRDLYSILYVTTKALAERL